MDEAERYKQAKARVDALKGFYGHLTSFLVVGVGLFLINAVTGGNWWFYWPMLFWGIGLAMHAASLFIFNGLMGPGWEERKMKEYLGESGRNAPPVPPA